MKFAKLVNDLVREFEKTAGKEHSTALKQLLTEHEADLKDSLSRKSRKRTATEGPKRTNWQAVWTSNGYGCRAYPTFKKEFERMQKDSPDLGRFELNKRLRTWATDNNHYEGWQKWASEKLKADGKPIPGETHKAEEHDEVIVEETKPAKPRAKRAKKTD